MDHEPDHDQGRSMAGLALGLALAAVGAVLLVIGYYVCAAFGQLVAALLA